MSGRLVQIVGMTFEGHLEIEEEFEVLDAIPIYAAGSSLPVDYARTPGVERRRRIVSDPVELEAIKAKNARPA